MSTERKSLVILGRQPAIGLAELESLYGAKVIEPIGQEAALLDLSATDVDFDRLGGAIKLAEVLTYLPHDWPKVEAHLLEKLTEHAPRLPAGKFTLGLSVYGTKISPTAINRSLLKIKSVVRKAGRPVRVVPNKNAELNSAQVWHNKLTSPSGWELVLVRHQDQMVLARTVAVQDIGAYGARDQARPKRDARVGMLPPKLAQVIINLAKPPAAGALLDPFCGTGVILQEALLMDLNVIGTDIDQRMVDYAGENLEWLRGLQPNIVGQSQIELGDATDFTWPTGVDAIASETYLGRPLANLPSPEDLRKITTDVDTILTKFLKNLSPQLKPGLRMCLAVPAWRIPKGYGVRLSEVQGEAEQRSKSYRQYDERAAQGSTQQLAKRVSRVSGSAGKQTGSAHFVSLPLIAKLTDMGYNHLEFQHAASDELIYYREGQVVARQLLVLEKV